MKNKDMFLIDDSQENKNFRNWFDSFEDAMLNILTSVGFIIALVLIAVNVEAASFSENSNPESSVALSDIHRGSLLYKTDKADRYIEAASLKTDVSMTVSGMVVRTKLIQQFKNETSEWLEGIYVFPLPESAAVDHMKLRIGERTIEGKIKERKEAKRLYIQAKREGKKASLVEQERPNLFTNSVANIGPGEIVSVEIEYQQILKYDNGKFKLRFPTTITPRYIPGSSTPIPSESLSISQGNGWAFNTTQVADASRITPPQYSSVNNPINIHIDLNAGFPITEIASTYHQIKSVMHLEGHYTVSLLNENVPSDRDFELVWQPELANSPQAALFSEPSEHQDYHLVMIMPPEDTNSNNQVLARDVTYIIDTSGSMNGESMRQAKAALQLAITRLRSFDKFNIIEF
ncbi:MAG: VIT domain-containing protein, partial [Gammaproteobacteria bacterium]